MFFIFLQMFFESFKKIKMLVKNTTKITEKTAKMVYSEEVKKEQFRELAENTGNIGREILMNKYV